MQKIIIGLAPNMTVEVSSDNVKQVIEQASFWGQLPKACPLCQASVVFFHRDPDENNYWGLNCTGPVVHETNFGIYKKAEKGLFYKGEWKEAYKAYQQQAEYAGGPQVSPIAPTLGDMITSKQASMIYAISKAIGVDKDDECRKMFNCTTDELSKRTASGLIEHLQKMQEGFPAAQASVTPAAEEPSRPLPPAPANDDIPF